MDIRKVVRLFFFLIPNVYGGKKVLLIKMDQIFQRKKTKENSKVSISSRYYKWLLCHDYYVKFFYKDIFMKVFFLKYVYFVNFPGSQKFLYTKVSRFIIFHGMS